MVVAPASPMACGLVGALAVNPTMLTVSRPAESGGTATLVQSSSCSDPSPASYDGSQSLIVDFSTARRLAASAWRSVTLPPGWTKSSVGSPAARTSRTVDPCCRAEITREEYVTVDVILGSAGSARETAMTRLPRRAPVSSSLGLTASEPIATTLEPDSRISPSSRRGRLSVARLTIVGPVAS